MDRAILQARFAKEEEEMVKSGVKQQMMNDLKSGSSTSQIKAGAQEKKTVLRHGSAVRRQEVQISEAAVKRHATTSVVSPPQTVTSPPRSGQSTPKFKRPTSQACSVM